MNDKTKNNIPLKNVFYFTLLIQFVSLVNIFFTGSLNGDFSSFKNINWIILISTFILSVCPFWLLYFYLNKKKYLINYSFIGEIKYFSPIVISLLLINVFLAIKYKVGRLANYEIYEVPFFIKPFIVLVNRIDAYIIAGYHIISNLFTKKNNLVVIVLLIALSFSRASVFVILFLVLIYSLYGKFNLNFKKIAIFSVIFLLTYQYVPILFDFRESLRNGVDAKLINILDKTELVKFVISKLIGRVSSLSAVEYYYEHFQQIKRIKGESGSFDFIIEFFRPFYGAFYRDNIKGTTYFFTNLYDSSAGSDYGVMYALPSVFLLSFIKGIHILLINIVFIISIILIIVDLAAFLFGNVFKEFVYILLFGPIMSGVPAEFGQLLFYLLTLSLIKLFYRRFMLKNIK